MSPGEEEGCRADAAVLHPRVAHLQPFMPCESSWLVYSLRPRRYPTSLNPRPINGSARPHSSGRAGAHDDLRLGRLQLVGTNNRPSAPVPQEAGNKGEMHGVAGAVSDHVADQRVSKQRQITDQV